MDASTSNPTMIDYLSNEFWALKDSTMAQLTDILERHYKGDKLDAETIANITAQRDAKGSGDRKFTITQRGTAIIPISGVIAKHSRMVNGMSQPRGTSVEYLREQFAKAMDDRKVTQIMLHVESPGGSVNGIADFAQSVFDASFEKPVVAYIDDLGASAAYWIASSASKVYANQTGNVGSIGVYALYIDTSDRAEKMGLKYMIFRSGANKGIGAPGIKITEGNAEAIQKNVNATAEVFIQTILKGRASAGLDEQSLRDLADGQCYVGKAAADNNLVDGIMTFDQALAALESTPPALRTEDTIVAASVAEETINVNESKEHEMAKDKTEAAAIEQGKIDAAVKAETERVTGINAALPGEALAAVRDKAIAEKMTVDEAKASAFDAVQAANTAAMTAKNQELAEASAKLDAIAAGGAEVVAAEAIGEQVATTVKAGKNAADDGKASTYAAAVEKYKADGMKNSKAIRKASNRLPISKQAWLDDNQHDLKIKQ